jgi:hypothetical protein
LGEGNAVDSVGDNNGTLEGDVSFSAGKVGQAFSFNGASSYVSIPDSPSLDSFTNSITIELWLKVNSLTANPNWMWIVAKGNASWRMMGTTYAKTITFSAAGASSNDLSGTRNVNDGQWHHVAGVYDGTNMFLYVDGTLDASQPAAGLISQNSYPLCIGENAASPANIFNGSIDEVSLGTDGLGNPGHLCRGQRREMHYTRSADHHNAADEPDEFCGHDGEFQRHGWRHATLEPPVELQRNQYCRGNERDVDTDQRAVEPGGELCGDDHQSVWFNQQCDGGADNHPVAVM